VAPALAAEPQGPRRDGTAPVVTVAEMAFTGLAMFGFVVLFLTAADAIVTFLLGPDPDLREPWDPRA